jgi:AmiR/NasT family two-component response regulator
MTSVLVMSDAAGCRESLQADLERIGIHFLGAVERDDLVRSALQMAPDVVLVEEANPDPGTFAALAALQATAPRPVVLYAGGIDGDGIARAVSCGVHALVLNGYDGRRLRSLIHLAQVRFRQEDELRRALADLNQRFDERKLVDRAKGILMRATQLPEEEAFRILRKASMRGNRRVGQVSREVIAAARDAESVNRAGQLRMMSQRLVKLHALLASDTETNGTAALLGQTIERTEANLARLAETLSSATYGDLMQPIQATWKLLRRPPTKAPEAARLDLLDGHAEKLLRLAEQLTASLELDGSHTPLHLINVSGRQRMLSQRVAKLALLGALGRAETAASARDHIAASVAEFNASLQYLRTIPLATPQTRALLATAQQEWTTLVENIEQADSPSGRLAIAGSSEALLEAFDRLTAVYERSMAILTDPQAGE